MPHPFELREWHAGRLGDVADGDPSPVFVLLSALTDVPDIHVVTGGSEIEMHVDVHVKLARHFEHSIELTATIWIRVGRGAHGATTPRTRLEHQLVGTGIDDQ